MFCFENYDMVFTAIRRIFVIQRWFWLRGRPFRPKVSLGMDPDTSNALGRRGRRWPTSEHAAQTCWEHLNFGVISLCRPSSSQQWRCLSWLWLQAASCVGGASAFLALFRTGSLHNVDLRGDDIMECSWAPDAQSPWPISWPQMKVLPQLGQIMTLINHH